MARVMLALALWTAGYSMAAPVSPWPRVGKESRPWTYWWWMGSAVDAANITKELTRYREAGLGGVHIIPIYGAKGFEKRYLDYLSPRWMEMLNYTIAEANRLGLGVDMTLGTGWCFGGPDVSGADACTVAQFREGQLVLETCRQAVKRAAPGGTGPMLNPFSASAMRNYTLRFDKAFARLPGARPRAVYHDSFEYQANWSAGLPEAFARMRGYRLEPYLAELFGTDTSEEVARLKSDYRETLSDLLVEEFATTWIGWSHKQNLLTRYQAHGSPANLLDLYGMADIPETEMFREDRNSFISMFASSAAHVMGRRFVASETGTWAKEHFQERLADLKDVVDQLFVAGVNHVVYHGTAYSPDDAAWPGWLFYASTEMNPRNSIWRDVPALNFYIARVQSVLQSGRPDADVLLYWPVHDLWHDAKGLNNNLTVHHPAWLEGQPAGKLAREMSAQGFSFDFVSDRQLALAQVKSSRLELPGGSYSAIVIPKIRLMPSGTMRQLDALSRAGAQIVFAEGLPEDVPGLGDLEKRRGDFRVAKDSLSSRSVMGLQKAKLRKESIPVPYLRRALDDGHVYLLANRENRELDGWVPFSVPMKTALLLDPMSGRWGTASVRNGQEVRIQLRPGESLLVRTYTRVAEASPWQYWASGGAAQPLSGTWQVSFPRGGPKLPGPFTTTQLGSWTSAGDAAEAFAGTALYKLEFDQPGSSSSDTWLLNLGDVRESARVRVNGKYLGTLIAPPYTVTVSELKPVANLLEIEVTNLTANRIRDLDRRKVEWRKFHDINFVNWDYKPFDASAWPVKDSGMLGPVTLKPLVAAQ